MAPYFIWPKVTIQAYVDYACQLWYSLIMKEYEIDNLDLGGWRVTVHVTLDHGCVHRLMVSDFEFGHKLWDENTIPKFLEHRILELIHAD